MSRIRDLCIATVAFVLSLPVLVVLGLSAGVSSKASPIFRQIRVGLDGRHFVIYKLRTLYPDAPADVHRKHSEHMATPVGRFLRAMKIDELPQLWNVIKGDMSLVGPRPIIPEEYGESPYHLRLAVRPGLTGLWQLSRVRENRFDKNPEYDLFYLANRSFAFDVWLIWRTVLLLLTGRETKIRLAARIWERNRSWRRLVPERAKAIPPRRGMLRSHAWAVYAVLGVAGLMGLGTLQMFRAGSELETARSAMVEARAAIGSLDSAVAAAAIKRADSAFARAERHLRSWPAVSIGIVPGLRQNRQVALSVAEAGADLANAGTFGLEAMQSLPTDNGRISPPFKNGVLDGAALARAANPARALQSSISAAQKKLASSPETLLLPRVRRARADAIRLLSEVRRQTDVLAGTTLLIPKLFGLGEPRTWILGAENNAELRGRGGYLGSIGTLHADGGRVSLGDFRPVSGLPALPTNLHESAQLDPEYLSQYLNLGVTAAWPNLMMSPDFPTGAKFFLSNLESTGGIKAEGLISLDPIALSYLMEATGPVEVAGIPEPLTSANVVDWSLNRLYFLYSDENDERRELLSGIAAAVWSRLLSAENLDSRKVADALGRAISGRHLVIYSTRPEEQKLIEMVGAGGLVKPSDDDYLLLVAQNVGENKMDYYQSRDISYSGVVLQDGSLEAEAQITMRHSASPSTALPNYVGGARKGIDIGPGRVRSFLSLFVPERAQLKQMLRDGVRSADFGNTTEAGKRRLGVYVELAPGESQTITFKYLIPNGLKDGEYRLLVQNQATVKPDLLTAQIEVPSSLQINHRSGFEPGAKLTWNGDLDSTMELSSEISPTTGDGVLGTIISWLRRPIAGKALE